jgi:hypothetical protein
MLRDALAHPVVMCRKGAHGCGMDDACLRGKPQSLRMPRVSREEDKEGPFVLPSTVTLLFGKATAFRRIEAEYTSNARSLLRSRAEVPDPSTERDLSVELTQMVPRRTTYPE